MPQVVIGDPHAEEVTIVWETSAACKTSTSLRYTPEAKCYHIHTYQDNGLKANFIDLTSLVRPLGYQALSAENTQFKFLVSVCRPLRFATPDRDHPGTCNGTMACLVGAGGNLQGSVPLVLGDWTTGPSPGLRMHQDLLTVQYTTNHTNGACSGKRNVTIHFICPDENQVGCVCVCVCVCVFFMCICVYM